MWLCALVSPFFSFSFVFRSVPFSFSTSCIVYSVRLLCIIVLDGAGTLYHPVVSGDDQLDVVFVRVVSASYSVCFSPVIRKMSVTVQELASFSLCHEIVKGATNT
jgi:hypothetical protein